MSGKLDKIFLAHFEKRLPLMLWGSSGYGKSSMVKEFARTHDFALQVIHAQYLDPLALFIPSTSEMKELGYAKVCPSQVLHRVVHSQSWPGQSA